MKYLIPILVFILAVIVSALVVTALLAVAGCERALAPEVRHEIQQLPSTGAGVSIRRAVLEANLKQFRAWRDEVTREYVLIYRTQVTAQAQLI